MGAAVRFRQANVARQPGELARVRVVQGPDHGAVFVLTSGRASIGRGENNDIVITDLKASRRHVELQGGPMGWKAKDLGSSNGIFFNGQFVREVPLKNKEVFSLGETILEFLVSPESGTMMLVAPPPSLAQNQLDASRMEAQLRRADEVKSLGGMRAGGPATARPVAKKGPAGPGLLENIGKNPKLLVGLLVLGGLLFWNPEEPAKNPKGQKAKKPKEEDVSRELAALMPQLEAGGEAAKTADVFFKTGFREYTLGNFLRAKTQFETVLQIDPGHRLARLYAINCDKQIEEQVKRHIAQGRKSLQAGRLKESKANFEAVMRLLYRNRAAPEYEDARQQLESITKRLTPGYSGGAGGTS